MNLSKAKTTPVRDLKRLNAFIDDRPNPQHLMGLRSAVALAVDHTNTDPPLRKMILLQGCKVTTSPQQGSFASRLKLAMDCSERPEMNWIAHAEQRLGGDKHILVVRHESEPWDTNSDEFLFHKDVTFVGRSCGHEQTGHILVFTMNSIPSWIQLIAGGIYYRIYSTDNGTFPKIAGRASRDAKKIHIGKDETTVKDIKVILGGTQPWISYLTKGSSPLIESFHTLITFNSDSEQLLRQSLIDPAVHDSVLFITAEPNNPLTLLTSEAEGAKQVGQSFAISEHAEEPQSQLVILAPEKLKTLRFESRSGRTYVVRDIHSDKPKVEGV